MMFENDKIILMLSAEKKSAIILSGSGNWGNWLQSTETNTDQTTERKEF